MGESTSPLAVPRVAPPADVAAPPADAIRTPSPTNVARVLLSKVVTPGSGTMRPRATDLVQVHYREWDAAGTTLDDSHARGNPSVWMPAGLMEGLTLGIQLMVEGETRRLWIPEKLAYGGMRGAPQGMLVFDVELIKIES